MFFVNLFDGEGLEGVAMSGFVDCTVGSFANRLEEEVGETERWFRR